MTAFAPRTLQRMPEHMSCLAYHGAASSLVNARADETQFTVAH